MSPGEMAALEAAGAALRDAARRRDLGAVRGLVAEPDAVRWGDERGRTALFHSRDPEILGVLLDAGADVNAADDGGSTPLLRHAVAGDAAVLTLLLDRGARVTAQDREGWTALHAAAAFLGIASMRLLLERGADPTIRNHDGAAPLHEALEDHNQVSARWLWEGPGPRDATGAAALGEVPELLALLDGAPSLLEAALVHGRAPLHWAARHGSARSVRALLERGAAPDARDGRGWTPLHWAAQGMPGNERRGGTASRDVAQLLLSAGADPSPRDASGRTPLDLAIRADRVKPAFIALLESRGARSTPIPGEER